MLKVRITAIRQTVYNDLIAQYENPIEHACDIQQGQQWISINGTRPDGLCPSAWDSMKPFVESLAHGKGNFFDGWMKNPMSAMISCNDGFRPFSFYIETIKEEPGTSSRQTGGEASTEKSKIKPHLFSKRQGRGARIQTGSGSRKTSFAAPPDYCRLGYAPTEPPHFHQQLSPPNMGTWPH